MTIVIETLWREYQETLHQFIARKVKNEEDTKDLVQEVFVKAFTHSLTLRDPQKVEQWLWQIARRIMLNYFRNRQRKRKSLENEPIK